jgi:hypothetical protein
MHQVILATQGLAALLGALAAAAEVLAALLHQPLEMLEMAEMAEAVVLGDLFPLRQAPTLSLLPTRGAVGQGKMAEAAVAVVICQCGLPQRPRLQTQR